MVQAKQYREDLYFLEDERVRQFLFLGPQEALLLDTGFPDSHIGRLAEELAGGRPVRVAMTHGDPDHTGGLGTFGECWMHRGDWPMVDSGLQLHPLAEGDVLTCGGWRLEVIEIPGHTPGSVAFFDPARRLLFPGDSVQQGGPIYLFGSHRNLDRYIASLEKLLAWQARVDLLLPCHHSCPISPDYIAKNLEDAKALRAGQLPGEKDPAMPCSTYQGRWTTFYYAE